MKLSKSFRLTQCLLVTAFVFYGTQASALLVPDPVGFSDPIVDTCSFYGLPPNCGLGYYESDYEIDGLPVAQLNDEFVTYSAHLLDQWQDYYPEILPVATYGVYDFATGTGGLDVILYTGAGTKNRNKEVGPDLIPGPPKKGSFSFEDPVAAPAGSETSLEGWWGKNIQLTGTGSPDYKTNGNKPKEIDYNGPVTVSYVLEYLNESGALSIPAFYMDMNQEGRTNEFLISGEVYLADPATGLRITDAQWNAGIWGPGGVPTEYDYQWAFDMLPNGDLDTIYPVLAPGAITYEGDDRDYELDHNLGSGKPDYIGFFPTLDLQVLSDAGFGNLWFVLNVNLSGINDGFEEIFMTGLVGRPDIPPAPVPEPATMLLLGTGLIGVAGAVRRRKKNQA